MAQLELVYAPNNSKLFVLPIPVLSQRDPTVNDVNYASGQVWYNKTARTIWMYKTAGIWVEIAGAAGPVIAVNGTANQITASTTLGTVTLSIPATFIAPGSIASTTTITAATGMTVSAGNLTLGDTVNIVANATTGTKIGTATTQKFGFYNATPVVQQLQGAIINSVTAGGTTGTIANYTDLTIYANDSTAIRNDIYQLALGLQGCIAALRTYGLLA